MHWFDVIYWISFVMVLLGCVVDAHNDLKKGEVLTKWDLFFYVFFVAMPGLNTITVILGLKVWLHNLTGDKCK